MRRIERWAALMVVLAGCGSGSASQTRTTIEAVPTSSVAVAAPAPATTVTVAATTTAASTTVAPAPAVRLGALSVLPPIDASAYARSGATEVVVGAVVDSGTHHQPTAAVRSNGGAWQVVTIDDGNGYQPPATAATNRQGFVAASVAAGPAGFVAVGAAGFFVGNYARGTGGLVWFSTDGMSWQRIDVRASIPDQDPSGIALDHVVATSAGYVVSGTTGGHVFTLTSPDGTTWTETGSFQATWSMLNRTMLADRNTVLLWSDEFACLTSPFGGGAQPRFQLSADGGATWAPVDVTKIPTIGNVHPEPDAATCAPVGNDLNQLAETYRANVGAVGIAAGVLTVASSDFTTVAVSTDHTTWRSVPLPAPQPAADNAYFRPAGTPSAVFSSPKGITMLAGSGPAAKGQPKQLVGWTSADHGASWTSITGGPLVEPVGTLSLFPSADGSSAIMLFQPMSLQQEPNGAAETATISLT